MREGVGRYLRSLWEDHASGEAVAETSGYGALQALMNDAGRELNPSVRAIVNIRNRGAGIPDGGLFTADQLRRRRGGSDPATDSPTGFPAQLPARGAVEVKGVREDAGEVSRGEQVGRYLERYGQVLVTNYREFVLVGRDRSGDPVEIESFSLAGDAAGFWWAAESHRETAAEKGPALWEFLKRAMLHGAPLSQPRDLAWFLASHAREALALVEGAGELRALSQVREALQGTLGVAFEGRRGEHFFRSTLVQTLFYGVFSAWVLWSKQRPHGSEEAFDWRVAAYILNVPMIRALFEQLVMPSRVGALGLDGVLERTSGVLNRVDRAAFFDNFDEEGAVRYFYEPFLEAFDPELRRQLGVWYTPPEVVRYMVERTDRVLEQELGVEDGLAGEEVYVLDPCTGTGSYLVEVLKKIAERQGGDALSASDLKAAATDRVFGFELLPAPFVVAHLQLGLLLQRAGAPLAGAERAGVFLTNALTGWEPADDAKRRLPLPEFEEEREAAEEVKRRKPILVVIGNPPYNGFAGVGVDEEHDLSDAYRATSGEGVPAPRGQGLNDLYVRFFRVAEKRIVEGGGRGVVCFISNYSWLDGLSFSGMRERYLSAFDRVWVDNLNGDRYRTGKVAPDGRPDPSIFSTPFNREGIQIGTAISLLARRGDGGGDGGPPSISFRDLWGPEKRAQLIREAEGESQASYEEVVPAPALGLPFRPIRSGAAYPTWPALPELFPAAYPGVKTSRDSLVVDADRDRLIERMERYFDPSVGEEEMRRLSPAAMRSTARFDAPATRRRLQRRGLLPDNFVRYCYRPFDLRWLYWEPETKLLDEKRPGFFSQVFEGNVFLEARGRQPKDLFDRGYVTSALADNFGNGLSSYFPLLVREPGDAGSLFAEAAVASPRPNLSEAASAYLEEIGAAENPEDLFYHALAVLHSPAYRDENAGGLRQDWPRVALPARREDLARSASLGREVAALLDPARPVRGVTTGSLKEELRGLAAVTREGGGALDPGAGDLAVTAGWGYTNRSTGATMAGRGRAVARDYAAEERGADPSGDLRAVLGEETVDVYLNDRAYLANVPAKVWAYTAGGYQVLKKWLSYRELEVLGRPLSPEEVRELASTARRIAALLLLGPELDANYRGAAETAAVVPAAGGEA